MKYMTPELLARVQSSDEQVTDVAEKEWELAGEAYRRHLWEISPDLPDGAKRFLRRYCLHDARTESIVSSVHRNQRFFSLVLRLDNDDQQFVRITYALAPTPNSLDVRIPDKIQNPRATAMWLYDEFDVSGQGLDKVSTHSILFTGGVEIRLAFRKFNCVPIQWFDNLAELATNETNGLGVVTA